MTTDDTIQLATERHRAGDLAEARQLYEEVLAQEPANAVALVRSGLLAMHEGHPDRALAQIQLATEAAPQEPRYPFVLGEVLASLNRWPDAAAAYRRSLAIDPRAVDVNLALAVALQTNGDLSNALSAYQAVTQLQSDHADAFVGLGNCQQLLGDFAKAEEAYRCSLALRPDFAGAMSNLGMVLQVQGRPDEAVAALRAAVKIAPELPGPAVNLGAVLCEQRKFTEAETVLRGTLERDANVAEAAYNLGNALCGLGRQRDAIEQYRYVTSLRPDYLLAHLNLGNTYKALGEFKLALSAYTDAIRTQPDSADAANNLGCLLRTVGKIEGAETVLCRGLAFSPQHPALHNNLGNVLKDSGDLDGAIACFRQSLKFDPTNAEAHGNLVYAMTFQSPDGEPVLEESLRWNTLHAAPLRSGIRVHTNDRSASRRLRIGYVSPDFRDHCQSIFTSPLLSRHDHGAFEIFCYSSVERPDDYTRRIAGFADVWREVRPLDDAELCALIRADRIDILVDLTMHMAGGRPLLFARKPAPVQVAWLAYPGTTGISAMDYRLSDPRLDPPDFDDQYTERTIRLPNSFWCYDPLIDPSTDAPVVNALPALTRGSITLGCLNNPCKLSDHTLHLWAGVMRSIPDARLLLMAPPGSGRQRLVRQMAANGISPERVGFVPFRPRNQYLRSYHDIDLGLDTIPYNGHTTSLDSFWMGVPVVTRIGKTCVGRAGLSQLFQLGLLDLAIETDDGFIDAAVALARDLTRLSQLRQNLRARLEQSPLMDAKRFARNIERVYRQIFREYAAHSHDQPAAEPDLS